MKLLGRHFWVLDQPNGSRWISTSPMQTVSMPTWQEASSDSGKNWCNFVTHMKVSLIPILVEIRIQSRNLCKNPWLDLVLFHVHSYIFCEVNTKLTWNLTRTTIVDYNNRVLLFLLCRNTFLGWNTTAFCKVCRMSGKLLQWTEGAWVTKPFSYQLEESCREDENSWKEWSSFPG